MKCLPHEYAALQFLIGSTFVLYLFNCLTRGTCASLVEKIAPPALLMKLTLNR